MPLVFTDTDFQRFSQFDGNELLRLYQFLTRLQRMPPTESVVSVRLPPDTVDHVRRLAVKRRQTRSDLVRQAVVEFVQRNPAFIQ